MRALKMRVRPHADLAQAWGGFWELHELQADWERGGRPLRPIPAAEVNAWLDINAVRDPARRRELFEQIRLLDREWLSIHRAKAESEAKAKPSRRKPE